MKKQKRKELEEFRGKPCPFCGRSMNKPTRDHIDPVSRGFTLQNHNKIIICSPCNTRKANMGLEEFVQVLYQERMHINTMITNVEVLIKRRIRWREAGIIADVVKS